VSETKQAEQAGLPEVIDPNEIIINNVTDKFMVELAEEFKNPEALDLSNKEEYEFARLGIRKLVGLRTGLENHKKEKTKLHRDYIDAVNNEANKRTGQIRSLEDPLKEVKKTFDNVKEEEKLKKKLAEATRVKKITDEIEDIGQFFIEAQGKSAVQIKSIIVTLEEIVIDEEFFQEFKNQAVIKRQGTIENMENLYKQTLANEEETKRLEEDRKKFEAEKAKQAEEDAKKEKEANRFDMHKRNIDRVKEFLNKGKIAINEVAVGVCLDSAKKIYNDLDFQEFEQEVFDMIAAAEIVLNQRIDDIKEDQNRRQRVEEQQAEQEETRKKQAAEAKRLKEESEEIERKKNQAKEREEYRRKEKNEAAILEMRQSLSTVDNLDSEALKKAKIIFEGCSASVDEDFQDRADNEKKKLIALLDAKIKGAIEKEAAAKQKEEDETAKANELSLKISDMRKAAIAGMNDILGITEDAAATVIDAIENGDVPHIWAYWKTNEFNGVDDE